MQIRTCPHCGHKYSARIYILKVLMKFKDYSGWPCEQCGTSLTVKPKRRLWISLAAYIPFFILNTALIIYRRSIGLSLLETFLVAVAFLLFWIMIIYSYDTFKEKE